MTLSVALIFPRLVDSIDKFDDGFWLTDKLKHLLSLGRTNYTPPLSLLTLAAVTPANIDLVIIDERLEEINYDLQVDLVGISVVTRAAIHAYEIADKFKQRGVKVVLGGIHPTVLPDEALQHADIVVSGEGEKVWPVLLNDLIKGNIKKIYTGNQANQSQPIPIPRRELLRNPEEYFTTKVITATRGCSNTCTFCSAGFAIGKTYRKRDISDVVKEIESIPGKYVIFLDDNLGCDIEYAKKLFWALKPLKINWAGAISVPALEDEDLVKAASESGCISLGVGFESISKDTLKAMGKTRTNNPDKFKPIIKRLHRNGIPILGYFILGFDPDTTDTYKELADFIEETCIEMPSINTLIPYPGSPIYTSLLRQNRILSWDWSKYDTAIGSVVYRPKNMSPEQLVENYLWLTKRIYSSNSVFKRLARVGYFDVMPFAWTIHYNYQQKQSVAIEAEGNQDAKN